MRQQIDSIGSRCFMIGYRLLLTHETPYFNYFTDSVWQQFNQDHVCMTLNEMNPTELFYRICTHCTQCNYWRWWFSERWNLDNNTATGKKITKIRNAFYYSMRQMLNNFIDLNNNWDLRVWNAKKNEVHTTTAEIRLIQINPMYGV